MCKNISVRSRELPSARAAALCLHMPHPHYLVSARELACDAASSAVAETSRVLPGRAANCSVREKMSIYSSSRKSRRHARSQPGEPASLCRPRHAAAVTCSVCGSREIRFLKAGLVYTYVAAQQGSYCIHSAGRFRHTNTCLFVLFLLCSLQVT